MCKRIATPFGRVGNRVAGAESKTKAPCARGDTTSTERTKTSHWKRLLLTLSLSVTILNDLRQRTTTLRVCLLQPCLVHIFSRSSPRPLSSIGRTARARRSFRPLRKTGKGNHMPPPPRAGSNHNNRGRSCGGPAPRRCILFHHEILRVLHGARRTTHEASPALQLAVLPTQTAPTAQLPRPDLRRLCIDHF